MDENELLSKIQDVKDWNGRTLDLYNCGITHLPAKVGELNKLEELVLEGNHLTSLPSQIGQLRNLRVLDLRRNRLKRLPPQISRLSNLCRLLLNDNDLRVFPKQVLQLPNLVGLLLAGNHISELPADLFKCTQLIHLDLARNNLTHLPRSIAKLVKLQALDVSQNRLTSLPIGTADFDRLVSYETWVHFLFYGNPLLPVPPEYFGMSEDDFSDFGWRVYFRALDKIDRVRFERALTKAKQYCDQQKSRDISRIRLPQTKSYSSSMFDDSGDGTIG